MGISLPLLPWRLTRVSSTLVTVKTRRISSRILRMNLAAMATSSVGAPGWLSSEVVIFTYIIFLIPLMPLQKNMCSIWYTGDLVKKPSQLGSICSLVFAGYDMIFLCPTIVWEIHPFKIQWGNRLFAGWSVDNPWGIQPQNMEKSTGIS